MTGPEGAPAVSARPDEQAVAEAKRYLRDRTGSVDDLELGAAGPRTRLAAATIVRAVVAAEPPDEPWAALREIAAYGCDRFTEPGDPTCRDSVERAAWCGCCVARAALAGARPAAGPDEMRAALQEIVDSHDRSCDCERALAQIAIDALAGARPAAEPDESMTDAERAIAPFLAWVENFRKNAPELGQALRQRLDEIRATLPTGAAHQPDGEGGGTGDGTTETRTEWRVTGTDLHGTTHTGPGGEEFALADHRALVMKRDGWSDVRVESRAVTTTRTVTPWKAEQR